MGARESLNRRKNIACVAGAKRGGGGGGGRGRGEGEREKGRERLL